MRLSSLTRLRVLARAERGQTAAEFIAMLGVVAAVMTLVVAPGIGDNLLKVVDGQISCILTDDGGNCGGEGATAQRPPDQRVPDRRPPKACNVNENVTAEQVQADVAVVRVGRNDQATVLERSDETAAVTFVDRRELGGVARTPGATIETGTPTGTGPDKPGQPGRTGAPTPGPEEGRGRNLSGEASAVVQFAGGNGYEFRSLEEAEAFLDKHADAEGLGGEIRENLGQVSRAVCLWQCDDPVGLRPDQPPPPPVVFREGGAKVDAAGDFEKGPASADVALGGAGALGVREDNRNGERTYYHRISVTARGASGPCSRVRGARASWRASPRSRSTAMASPSTSP